MSMWQQEEIQTLLSELRSRKSDMDDLEDKLRGQINEYCNEFFDKKDAMIAYGKDVNSQSDLGDRRLFYDWYI
ncbi:MAG: hypothetical protein WCF23_19010, partial [Candidatus Nitrosopolaris sp.]